MSNLFRITASNPEAYTHYVDTIERGFTLDSIKHFLDEKQREALQAIYGDGLIRAWGATPGKGNSLTWKKLEIGDPILIYRKGHFEYYASVTFKLHYQDLAKHLWGVNVKGQTWEYMYFLGGLTELSVPVNIYNQLLGFSPDFKPYGFSATDPKKLELIKNKYGSIDDFIRYLKNGEWIQKDKHIPEEVKEEIIHERLLRPMGNVEILEANLENILVHDVEKIEQGLVLVGRQMDTKEVGRLDLLCEDKDGNLAVIELKRGAAGPSIIDQTQRYMGWAMDHKAKPGQKVRGIIVVGQKDTALEYAVKANPMMQVKEFSISIN
jgi:hypothetical protein